MKSFITLTLAHQGEEDHPLIRAAYAVGVGLLIVGTVLPTASAGRCSASL
jgi:hypothetical protein